MSETLPQKLDVGVKRPVIAVEIISPHLGYQLLARKGDVPVPAHIEQQVVPQLDIQSQANKPLYIMGYSLAGLFALWAMYQTDIFAGCATCSGSMWYPGFVEYVNSQPTLANKQIYISLGADVNCGGSDKGDLRPAEEGQRCDI